MKKRSLVIKGHATSVSMEDAFWSALKDLADERGLSLPSLIASEDEKGPRNLSSALRLLVLQDLQAKLAEAQQALMLIDKDKD